MPLLFLAAVITINIDPGTRFLPSQAGIVSIFNKLTADRPTELIYVNKRPYSATFYSGGKAKLIRNSTDIEIALRTGRAVYFVVRNDIYPQLTEELRQQLEIMTERNGFTLLRPNIGAAAPR